MQHNAFDEIDDNYIYDKLTSETSVPSGFAKAMKDQNINIDDTMDQYRTGVVGVFVEQTLQTTLFDIFVYNVDEGNMKIFAQEIKDNIAELENNRVQAVLLYARRID